MLFSDEAEQVYPHAGLDAFIRSEQAASHFPLATGPFWRFLLRLHRLQTLFAPGACPLRIALVTARSVAAHERALRTLRVWGVEVDEAYFLSGTAKGPLLRSFGADLFFDDQKHNCDLAAAYVPCAHVPYGVKNRPPCEVLQQSA